MGAGTKIMVVDNNGNPVQGACVVDNWTGISLGDNFDGYTDDNGLASIPCPRISHDLEGKFCFEVTNITRYKDWVYSEWIYSPEENIVSSACINTSARIVASGAGPQINLNFCQKGGLLQHLSHGQRNSFTCHEYSSRRKQTKDHCYLLKRKYGIKI